MARGAGIRRAACYGFRARAFGAPRNDAEGGMTATQVRLIRLGLIVALLALWEIYARFVSTSSLIAGPSDVALAWWPYVMGEPAVRLAVGVTLLELMVAFTLSVVFGMAIGILIGLSDIGRRSLYPIVLLLYGIPQAILLPLVV